MEREVDQINVIPLVDIMLVLLVIVLTTATFITTGQIPVNLAKASSASERHERPIIVTVTAEGGLFVDDRPLDDTALETVLEDRGRDSPVLVRADKVTKLERFVGIVDRVRSMGFQQVSLEVVRT
ncbi:MAG TPA: biopolymer transporter ExbD [Nitrospira sp.]|nr:biopolymer transporter ExbD [Nitrospira sp. NTP1]HQR14906.1 biopolymer transporter ExbD [Nitrospira sp.]HQV10485.1 biopolymer transporter ExbD [Nitrospira sp.]